MITSPSCHAAECIFALGEAEIIALSEGAKDMVYFRKLVAGLGEGV